jgi:hypothetical protein
MFVGHYAAGFLGKRAAPRVGLGWLLLAATLMDLLWAAFLLLGLEHARIVPGFTAANPLDLYDYPWSHSLLLGFGWSALAAAGWWLWRRDARGAAVLGAVVFSHWLLDLASHLPDLPLWPGGGRRMGLGLWGSVTATVVVEGGLWLLAVVLYARGTRARDRVGSVGLWAFVALLSAAYAGSFGGAPPSVQAIAGTNLTTALLLLWAAWFDRHREARG